jgi:hypothetical protein
MKRLVTAHIRELRRFMKLAAIAATSCFLFSGTVSAGSFSVDFTTLNFPPSSVSDRNDHTGCQRYSIYLSYYSE